MVKNLNIILKNPFKSNYFYSCFYLFIITINNTYSTDNNISKDWIYKKSNVFIVTHPTFYPKPKINYLKKSQNINFSMKDIVGINIGFVYMYNFNKNYGLSIGLYNALLSLNVLKYDFKIDDNVYNDLNIYKDRCFKCRILVQHASTIPIRFIYRKSVSNYVDLNLQAGIDIQIHPSFYYAHIINKLFKANDSLYQDAIVIEFENNFKKNISLVPYFGFSFGINQILKNKRYLIYQFSGHIPVINPYTNGRFQLFKDTPFETTGTYQLNPINFGIEVNYVFSFKNRKEKKPYKYFK
jgi:hypothetical protein